MYLKFDEFSNKIRILITLLEEMDKKLLKNKSAIVDMCILMGLEDQIQEITDVSKEYIEISRIFFSR